jgi:beta-RFAP synthase
MIDQPAVRVAVEPAATWSATGPAADRALAVARCVAPDRPHRVVVEACPPEHTGLGVGTQLSLAVARAVRPDVPAVELARLAGRGARSAIGVYGFESGGFLVDGGKRDPDAVAPLVARVDFPTDWRVVLLTPAGGPDWHGDRERDVFAGLEGPFDDTLCRLLLLGILPALAECDLAAFGSALGEYNARAGEPFRAAQGGTYAAPAVAELAAWLRSEGIDGVGQSSWGPTVFAVVGDPDRADGLKRAVRARWGDGLAVTVTVGRNRGAENADGPRT